MVVDKEDKIARSRASDMGRDGTVRLNWQTAAHDRWDVSGSRSLVGPYILMTVGVMHACSARANFGGAVRPWA